MPDIENAKLVERFDKLDKQIHLTASLAGLNQSEISTGNKKKAILIFHQDGKLDVETFANAPAALIRLFEIESKNPDLDVVLVRADTSDEVRYAYKNYFSDAKGFLNLHRTGKRKIKGRTRRFTRRPDGRR